MYREESPVPARISRPSALHRTDQMPKPPCLSYLQQENRDGGYGNRGNGYTTADLM